MKLYYFNEHKQFQETQNEQEADWIHIEQPTEVEIKALRARYQIPEDFITAGLDPYEIPRHEVFESITGAKIQLLVILAPVQEHSSSMGIEYGTKPFAMIMLSNKVLTICENTPDYIENIAKNDNKNMEKTLMHGKLSESHLILRILWRVTNEFITDIGEINQQIDEMEENIHGSTKNAMFDKLISIHKSLVYFHTAISKNHERIESIKEDKIVGDEKLSYEFLHDIEVASLQASVLVHESDEMISHLSEVFSSVISNNMNSIMKFLTALTLVLTIPQLIGSLWGMNVSVPLENHPLGFSFLVIVSVILSVLTISWLKKNDYF